MKTHSTYLQTRWTFPQFLRWWGANMVLPPSPSSLVACCSLTAHQGCHPSTTPVYSRVRASDVIEGRWLNVMSHTPSFPTLLLKPKHRDLSRKTFYHYCLSRGQLLTALLTGKQLLAGGVKWPIDWLNQLLPVTHILSTPSFYISLLIAYIRYLFSFPNLVFLPRFTALPRRTTLANKENNYLVPFKSQLPHHNRARLHHHSNYWR